MRVLRIRIIGALGLVAVTMAALPAYGKGHGSTAMAGPGLPKDFPLAPGLSACKPVVIGPEVVCDWHGIDGHAVYVFYHDSLPKAGYTLLPGAGEQTKPREMGALGFKKGNVKGAVTVTGKDVTIQVITGK